jgi:GNAT superfamily N-acetyltransferase
MQFRRLQPGDIEQAQDFATQGLRPHLYPSLRLEPGKVRAALEHFASSTTDFHMAAVQGNRIVGGIAALVHENLWFERCDATVVMFRATVVGVGAALLAGLKAWADDTMRVRRVFLPLEFDARPGMQRLVRRYGFNRTQLMCAYQKD